MYVAAIIHALLHGPDTFFHKSFCAATSACMSSIPCSVNVAAGGYPCEKPATVHKREWKEAKKRAEGGGRAASMWRHDGSRWRPLDPRISDLAASSRGRQSS